MDFDSDGRGDLISGSWPGELYWFRGEPEGKFAAGQVIKDRDGEAINIGNAAAVHLADWDGDGDLDLLVGNIQGEVHLVPNEGSQETLAFAPSRKLEARGKPIGVPHGDAGPFAADWDGDGKLDLLVGTGAGSVLLYRNIGTSDGRVLLAEPETLVPEGRQPARAGAGHESGSHGTRAKICVTDWNEDGLLDLLVGDFAVEKANRPEQTEEEKAAEEQARKRLSELISKYVELQQPSENATQEQKKPEDELEKLLAEIRKLQQQIPQEYEYHGWVWLYLRKSAADSLTRP